MNIEVATFNIWNDFFNLFLSAHNAAFPKIDKIKAGIVEHIKIVSNVNFIYEKIPQLGLWKLPILEFWKSPTPHRAFQALMTLDDLHFA